MTVSCGNLNYVLAHTQFKHARAGLQSAYLSKIKAVFIKNMQVGIKYHRDMFATQT